MIQKKEAERFNNYFSSVFKIDNSKPSHEDCLLSDFDGDALSNISISPADVKETLEQVKVGKTWGPDMISPRLLKECFYFLSVVYLFYNKPLEKSCITTEEYRY